MVGINEIRPALEAILFAAGDSVETERIAKVLGAEPWDVRQAAEQLAREYEENGRGFRLARMENRLQLVTAGEYSDVVSRTFLNRCHHIFLCLLVRLFRGSVFHFFDQFCSINFNVFFNSL